MLFCSTPAFSLCPLVEQVCLSPVPRPAVAHGPRGGPLQRPGSCVGLVFDFIRTVEAVKEAVEM